MKLQPGRGRRLGSAHMVFHAAGARGGRARACCCCVLLSHRCCCRTALALPRNSYMVRLSDGAVAAINDSFVELSKRLTRHHGHVMRRVHLWELVEGRDTAKCSLGGM